MTTIEPINLLVGVALLLLGRRLYWVFVAGVGFLAGALVAREVFAVESAAVVLMIALATGLIGALLAVALQYVVIAVAGFLAGAYWLHAVAQAGGWVEWAWVGFLVGGVVGMLLILAILDWALNQRSSIISLPVADTGAEPPEHHPAIPPPPSDGPAPNRVTTSGSPCSSPTSRS